MPQAPGLDIYFQILLKKVQHHHQMQYEFDLEFDPVCLWGHHKSNLKLPEIQPLPQHLLHKPIKTSPHQKHLNIERPADHW